MRDVVLVTVDCWRRDALDRMPRFSEETTGWARRTELTASAPTNRVFPAIFAATDEFEAYDDDGTVEAGLRTLPGALNENGYATGGFVAANPWLGKWSNHFDAFRNDGMRADGIAENMSTYSTAKKLFRLLRFRPRVSDREILTSGLEWWNEQSSPRFLWVHLMGPHAPYYPGTREAWRIGPIRSYLSIVENSRRDGDGEMSEWARSHLQRLYYRCVENLDADLTSFVRSIGDDALAVVTADHGEEFEHGIVGHARLYNETTRCPFVTNDEQLAPEASAIRQVDITPTVLDRLDIDATMAGEGRPADYATTPPQPMLNISEKHDRIWAGAQDETQKIIEAYDLGMNLKETERYRVDEDPNERSPVNRLPAEEKLRPAVESLVEKQKTAKRSGASESTGLDVDVEARLEELGYR